MKKFVMILMILLLFVVVFIKIENDVLYYSVFALLALLALVYYYISDYVNVKDITKELKSDNYFVIKAGIVKTDARGANLVKGVLVIYSSMVLFYARKSSMGGVRVLDSFSLEELKEYTVNAFDKNDKSISFTLLSGEVKKYSCRTIAEKENELREAMGY